MENLNKCVVRISTSTWSDSSGLYVKKSIRFRRLRCVGHNCLEEEIYNEGSKDTYRRILNLYDCEDGLYEVVLDKDDELFKLLYIEE